MLLVTFIEGALIYGVFPFVGADLHLRFGLSFTAIGLIVGAFAVGGLCYAASVRPLMDRLGRPVSRAPVASSWRRRSRRWR